MIKLSFAKMEGAGNDFMVVNCVDQSLNLTPEQISMLGNRKLGVGFDQLLMIENSTKKDIDFFYKIYNADGTQAEQCGNGARCLLLFLRDQNLSEKKTVRIATKNALMELMEEDNGLITVNMGIPEFEPSKIPILSANKENWYELNVDNHVIKAGIVSMGNPHAVQFVSDIESAKVSYQGPLIEKHPLFPRGCNAGFAEVKSRKSLSLRVWERGSGETLACGTGACAAAAIAISSGLVNSDVEVLTKGGTLFVKWPESDQPLWMTGPARMVFKGEVSL